MDLGLNGKSVLITGAVDGFGKALAKVFSKEGAKVIVHGRPARKNDLKSVCSEINNCDYVIGDLGIAGDVEEMWKKVKDVDILVNNAAIWPTAYVKEMETEDFKSTLDINLIAPFILCRNYVNSKL